MKNILLLVTLFSTSLIFGQHEFKMLNPKPSAARAMGLAFSNDQNGFIINNKRELLTTTNRGETWTKKTDLDFFARSIKFKDSIGLIVGDDKILRSNDYGANWKAVPAQNAFSLNSINFITKDTVYVSSSGNLQKSFDGGKTWNYGGYINSTGALKTVFTSSKVGHAACQNGRIVKTKDGGATWVEKSVENSWPSDFYSIAFPTPMTGYANRGHGTMLKTIDGGETWAELPSFHKEIYDMQFFTENIGFVAGYAGAVYKTTDGGATWLERNISNPYNSYQERDITALWFFDESKGIITGESGRIMKTENGGETWKGYATTYNDVDKIQFVDSNTAYFKTNYAEFFKTTDGGENWTQTAYPAHSNYSQSFQFVNNTTGYSIGGGSYYISGSVYKTTDGTATWSLTNNNAIILNEGLYSIDFLSENVGYVSGGYNNPSLFKTSNGGDSWQKMSSTSLSRMQFVSENVGFGIKSSRYGELYKTTDAGVTWELIYNPQGDIYFHFISPQIGFLKANNGILYKTVDGGLTWQESELPYYGFNKIKFVNENLGFVADDTTIYQTNDSGETWELIYQVDDNNFRIKTLDLDQQHLYFAGTNGRIYKSSLVFLSTQQFSKSSKTVVYPNPSKDVFKVKSAKNIIKLNVYDFSGRLILTKEKSAEINLSGFKNGVYFLEINYKDNTRESTKIIKN